jgi:DNA-binding MarR family transcriptional regulator
MTKDLLSNDPLYKLWVMLTQTRNATIKAREQELRDLGISGTESFILFVIWSMGNNKATPAEISRIVLRRPHTVSEFLSRMQNKGLVKKSRNPDNRSMVTLSLTRKGLQVYRQASKRQSVHRMLSVLPDEDRDRLMSYLQTIRAKALQEIGVERAAFYPDLDHL